MKTPTNVHALLEFDSGASVMLGASWDVWAHRHRNIELYGTDGALFVPDPNWFGGTRRALGTRRQDRRGDAVGPPVRRAERHAARPAALANYRTAGLADMAMAIIEGRDARCSLDRALHGIDVMTSILKSGEMGAFVEMQTTCTRPEPLDPEAARALLA